MNKKKNQEGQILLVVVLLLAAALTMVMTISFTSRTENQVSKLQQDADKTLVAAEAGIEAAIKANTGGTFSTLNLDALESPDSGIDTSQSSVSIQNPVSAKFVSPVITKDDQYTLYLASYDNNGNFGTAPLSTITVYYGNNIPCANLALELTVVTFDSTKPSDPEIDRFVADTSGAILGGTQIGNDLTKGSPPYYTILGTNFNCKTNAISLTPGSSGNYSKLLFARVIGAGASTKIGIDDSQLPQQGRYFTATAKSTSGVTKKIKLFQSYPQIPAEFFVTSF